MLNYMVLLIYVGVYFVLTILEQRLLHRYNVHSTSEAVSKFHPVYILLFMALVFMATLIFLLTADELIVLWYIRGAFAFLLIMHARLITLGHRRRDILIAVAIAVLIAHMRFSSDSAVIHNVFVTLAIVWIGPFIEKLDFMSVRRFIILSVLWMLYDMSFVWLSPGASVVSSIGDDIGFQLALQSGSSLIGTGDLLWAGLFLSVVRGAVWKWAGAVSLLFVGLLYGIIGWSVQFVDFFPLLVMWVPVGLGLFAVMENRRWKKQVEARIVHLAKRMPIKTLGVRM